MCCRGGCDSGFAVSPAWLDYLRLTARIHIIITPLAFHTASSEFRSDLCGSGGGRGGGGGGIGHAECEGEKRRAGAAAEGNSGDKRRSVAKHTAEQSTQPQFRFE